MTRSAEVAAPTSVPLFRDTVLLSKATKWPEFCLSRLPPTEEHAELQSASSGRGSDDGRRKKQLIILLRDGTAVPKERRSGHGTDLAGYSYGYGTGQAGRLCVEQALTGPRSH